MLNIRYYILTATIQSNVTYVIHRLEASSEPAEILSSTVILRFKFKQSRAGNTLALYCLCHDELKR